MGLEGRRSYDMGEKQTFLVRIIENRNATWQGNVTWLNQKKTENFRSFLELIKMMDAAVESGGDEG